MKIHQPHDTLAKSFLNNLEVARDFLQSHLPKEIAVKCDFSTLRIEPHSFIEDDLRSHVSDLLYSLVIDNEPGLIYCIVEAQDRPQEMMPLRMLRYKVSALKKYEENNKDKKLPVIFSMVLHTGKKPWLYALDFYQCFANPELAEATFLNSKLIDLSIINDDEIKQHGQAAFLELVANHIRDRDILNLAWSLVKLLKIYQITGDLYLHMIQYIFTCGQSKNFDAFIKILIEEAPVQYREATMTIAEQLENRGYYKGKMEEAVAIAKNLIAHGVDLEIIEKATGLSDSDLSKLKKTH